MVGAAQGPRNTTAEQQGMLLKIEGALGWGKFVMSCKHKLQPGITGGSSGLSARPVCSGVCNVMTNLIRFAVKARGGFTSILTPSMLLLYGNLFLQHKSESTFKTHHSFSEYLLKQRT